MPRFVLALVSAVMVSGCGDRESAEVSRCEAPAGVSNSPTSVQDAVDLVNGLPKPTTLPCFVEALRRPLEVHATRSAFSLQPAAGARSPRIFLFSEGLILSVVPAGSGRHLVEMGEVRGEARTLKAELKFPVEGEVEDSAPFEEIMFNDDLTSCAFCHAEEERALDIDYAPAYVSEAVQPAAGQRVSVASLRMEYETCDPALEAERCALFDAIFGGGEVVEAEFPASFATF